MCNDDVLRAATRQLGNYRLPGMTLYVTIEPCTMCVARIVHGAPEPRAGAIESAQKLFETGKFNHVPEIESGVLAKQCAKLMPDFFESKRKSSNDSDLASLAGSFITQRRRGRGVRSASLSLDTLSLEADQSIWKPAVLYINLTLSGHEPSVPTGILDESESVSLRD